MAIKRIEDNDYIYQPDKEDCTSLWLQMSENMVLYIRAKNGNVYVDAYPPFFADDHCCYGSAIFSSNPFDRTGV